MGHCRSVSMPKNDLVAPETHSPCTRSGFGESGSSFYGSTASTVDSKRDFKRKHITKVKGNVLILYSTYYPFLDLKAVCSLTPDL